MKLNEIRIRDPFFLRQGDVYYLYGTTDDDPWYGKGTGFDCYCSKDLENFDGPFAVFRPSEDFWADENFWAPEVVRYRSAFYMTASFKRKERCRGVQILCADHPKGPFRPVVNGPVTPENWECLDGTLFFQNGEIYLIFCHEWIQTGDGEICGVRLNGELTRAIEWPRTLFRASEAKWCVLHKEFGKEGYVTDGPYLLRKEDGIEMIWSGYSKDGYAVGIAAAKEVYGKWEQKGLLVNEDGGHGMIFEDMAGRKRLTFHLPNTYGKERVAFQFMN